MAKIIPFPKKQKFYVNEELLEDGSKVFNVFKDDEKFDYSVLDGMEISLEEE